MCFRPHLRLSLLVGLLLLVSTCPVGAHGYLLRSIPEERAVLERAPARVQYWFSESLEPDFSSLRVLDEAGNVVAEGGTSPDNPALLTARLPRGLPEGAYVVDMRIAFASDGHLIAQSRVFFIGEAGVAQGQAASDQAYPLEILWRALTFSGALLLFGTLTLYTAVLVPAWRNPAYAAGLLPPRVMRRLSLLIGVGLAAAVVGNLLALMQQAMLYFEADFARVLSQELWETVRTSTRFGDVWNWRLVTLALIALCFGASLAVRDTQREWVRPFWSAAAWAGALMLGTFSVVSHAAGSLVWPWVAISVNWLHTLFVGLWAGGLAALTFTLPAALQPLSGESRRLALLAAMSRFSRVAVASLFMVVTTGVYSSLNWVYAPSDLNTSYGGALLLKVVLVGGMVIVGALHHIALRPERYARWEMLGARVRSFLPSLRLETALAALVIGAMALLSATPVPIPAFIEENIPAPTQTLDVNGYRVTQSITPGGTGVNTYDTLVLRDGQPVDGLTVRTQLVQPARDVRGAALLAEDTAEGLYVAAGGEIEQPGDWWSLVDIRDSDGGLTRAAFTWRIDESAAVQTSRPPTLPQIAALAGVIAAVSFALYPSARAVYHRLDLRPAAITIALGAIAATVGLSLLGFWLEAQARAQYEATINPPPARVNTVLPTAESIERGQALFEAGCNWRGNGVLDQLIERLPRTRDEVLFAATEDGWRGLPACTGKLDDAQRWDLVNYIRTLG